MEKIRVMVVDDSRISCAILSDLLAKTNFEVVATARTAAEAVEMFERYRPTAVTMDMNLPDANGIECSKRLREIDRDVRIVMISAMRDESLIAQGKKAGIYDFIQKPVRINDLLEVLTNLCTRTPAGLSTFIESYVPEFNNAFKETLLGFTGQDCLMSMEKTEDDSLVLNGIAVLIGLTGDPHGRIVIHMDQRTVYKFTSAFLNRKESQMDDATAMETLQEATNIIVGRGVSMINDKIKDKELRITPPGIIVGSGVKMAGAKLRAFRTKFVTAFGTMYMEMGFAEEI